MALDGLLEFLDLATAQCLKEIKEPLEVSAYDGLKDCFVEQFSYVEDVFTEKHSHAHLCGPGLALFKGQFVVRGVGNKLQGTLVEIFLIVLASVVLREDICQVGIDPRVDVLLALDLLLNFSQYFEAVMMLAKI